MHEEKAANIRNRYKREAIALKKINPETSFSFMTMLRLLTINIMHDLRQSLRERSFLKFFREILMFRYNQFVGTYAGYKETETKLNNKLRTKYYYPPKREVEMQQTDTQQSIDYNE